MCQKEEAFAQLPSVLVRDLLPDLRRGVVGDVEERLELLLELDEVFVFDLGSLDDLWAIASLKADSAAHASNGVYDEPKFLHRSSHHVA